MKPFMFDTDFETDITAEWAKEDLEYSGAVMCHVYYGRGAAPSADNEVGNVLTAYRFAAATPGAKKIVFVTDGEDVGFAPMDDKRVWGDDEGRLIDNPDNVMGDAIESESMALLVYWENYGFAGGDDERCCRVRDTIAGFAGVDARHLTPPQ